MNYPMKHTKGPWVYSGEFAEIRSQSNGTQVCAMRPEGFVKSFTRTDGETEANARLIAACPDMIEALDECEHILALIDDSFYSPKVSEALTTVRLTIRKARGEQ